MTGTTMSQATLLEPRTAVPSIAQPCMDKIVLSAEATFQIPDITKVLAVPEAAADPAVSDVVRWLDISVRATS